MSERKYIQLSLKELEDEQPYAYWLMGVHIGDSVKNKLVCQLGRPSEVFHASEKGLREALGSSRKSHAVSEDADKSDPINKKLSSLLMNRRKEDICRAYENLIHSGISFYPEYHPDFPERLLSIPGRPFGIFVKGSMPGQQGISLAIVGARDCSEYGRYVAEYFAKKLAACGITIISGMARGIDGIAQRAALEAGGTSFGVLGCGVDICYPKSNEELYHMCVEKGGLLSTYMPGTPPAPGLFPQRNRIISGLSDGILIIEARNKSGTIITADMALEQGRDVFVIPGRVTDRLSDGCNGLIRQGASLIQSPEQLLEELSRCKISRVSCNGETSFYDTACCRDSHNRDSNIDISTGENSQFTLQEQAFLNLFDFELQSIEEIRRKMSDDTFLHDISLPKTMEMLMKFVMLGQLKAEGGYYGRSH